MKSSIGIITDLLIMTITRKVMSFYKYYRCERSSGIVSFIESANHNGCAVIRLKGYSRIRRNDSFAIGALLVS